METDVPTCRSSPLGSSLSLQVLGLLQEVQGEDFRDESTGPLSHSRLAVPLRSDAEGAGEATSTRSLWTVTVTRAASSGTGASNVGRLRLSLRRRLVYAARAVTNLLLSGANLIYFCTMLLTAEKLRFLP